MRKGPDAPKVSRGRREGSEGSRGDRGIAQIMQPLSRSLSASASTGARCWLRVEPRRTTRGGRTGRPAAARAPRVPPAPVPTPRSPGRPSASRGAGAGDASRRMSSGRPSTGPPGRRASGTRRAHRTVRPPLDDGSRKPHPGRHRCGRRREAGHHQPMPAQAALSSGIRARPAYSEAMLRVMSLGSLLLCRERLSAARRRSTERT